MYINKHIFWKYAKHGAKNELDNSAMETSLPKLQTFFVAEIVRTKWPGKEGGRHNLWKRRYSWKGVERGDRTTFSTKKNIAEENLFNRDVLGTARFDLFF